MKRDRVSYENYYEQNEDTYYVINKKVKVTDYIKMGFGFYIGFSAAHLLLVGSTALIKYNNQKK